MSLPDKSTISLICATKHLYDDSILCTLVDYTDAVNCGFEREATFTHLRH